MGGHPRADGTFLLLDGRVARCAARGEPHGAAGLFQSPGGRGGASHTVRRGAAEPRGLESDPVAQGPAQGRDLLLHRQVPNRGADSGEHSGDPDACAARAGHDGGDCRDHAAGHCPSSRFHLGTRAIHPQRGERLHPGRLPPPALRHGTCRHQLDGPERAGPPPGHPVPDHSQRPRFRNSTAGHRRLQPGFPARDRSGRRRLAHPATHARGATQGHRARDRTGPPARRPARQAGHLPSGGRRGQRLPCDAEGSDGGCGD